MNMPPDSTMDENFVKLVKHHLQRSTSRKVGFYMGVHEDVVRQIGGMYAHEKRTRV